MVTRSMRALIAALFLISASGAESTVEAQTEHHEHPGVSDMVPSAEGHAHGDSDDHHESPEDDCHHHVVHCCCGHSHASATASVGELAFKRASSRFAIPLLSSVSTPIATDLLHVPIA